MRYSKVRIHLTRRFGDILHAYTSIYTLLRALIHISSSATQEPKSFDPEKDKSPEDQDSEQDKSLGEEDSEQPSESDISLHVSLCIHPL